MTRIENWELILRVCEQMNDEVVASLRIAMLNDFGKVDAFSRGNHLKDLAKCVRSFFASPRKAVMPATVPGKIMILFPSASGSNLQNLLPVAQEAKRRGKLGGIVAGDHFRRTKCNALSEFDCVVSERELHSQVSAAFLPGSLKRAGRRLKTLVSVIQSHDAHCALRVKQNWGSYLRLMVESEKMAVAYERLMAEWKPSILFSTSDFWPFEFQCCWQARRRAIPTAIVQHGVINDICVWPTYHDIFLAWGETFRDQLQKQGAPANLVAVLGMPSSDALFRRAERRADDLPVKQSCLVFSHTQDRIEEPVLFEEYGRLLKSAIELSPQIHWKIKLHPAESDGFYRETGIVSLPNAEILPKTISLEDAVESCSAACTIRSTAGLQAMILRKPVVVLYPESLRRPPVIWPETGGGFYVRTADELVARLRQLAGDDEFLASVLQGQSDFLEKSCANRGRAAVAITDFLEQKAGDLLEHKSGKTVGLAYKS